LAPIGEREGVELILVSVEAWFHADWTFAPGPPTAAGRLIVRVGDAMEAEIELGSTAG
jgi:hypothetical protein